MHLWCAYEALFFLVWSVVVLHQPQQSAATPPTKKIELVKNGVASLQRGTQFWNISSLSYFSAVGSGSDASFKCFTVPPQDREQKYCTMYQDIAISCTNPDTLLLTADLLADTHDFTIVIVTILGANNVNMTFVNLNATQTNQMPTGSLSVNTSAKSLRIELGAYSTNNGVGRNITSGVKKVSVTLRDSSVQCEW